MESELPKEESQDMGEVRNSRGKGGKINALGVWWVKKPLESGF